MTSKLLFATVLALFLAISTRADTVTLTLDQTHINILPTENIQFYATITNNTNYTLDDWDDSILTYGFAGTVDPYTVNGGGGFPPTLLPGQSVHVSLGFLAVVNAPDGVYTVFGHTPYVDYAIGERSQFYAQAQSDVYLTVETTPEPSSIVLLGTGLMMVLCCAARRGSSVPRA